ncbi:hypothetical protein HPP92_019053 [Vanilla planifolia]|uniref:Response regulatory domain-containing protein n=1 Tax=Vanilla planifolia TaxID=51239 RepID=A0A835Q9Y2_VANPL|nr:hypothetical protein HPP92_019053 [Vanilla planifolia]
MTEDLGCDGEGDAGKERVIVESEKQKKEGKLSKIVGSWEDLGGKLHVLAVDDSIVERTFLERMLRKSEYNVTTAENGIRALEYLGLIEGAEEGNNSRNDLKVNLIITDYCMPGMTGYELMKKIKEKTHLQEIPVVIMSSENIPNRIEKCLEDGAKEFMLKPIQPSDVKRLKWHVKSMLCLGR